MFIPVSICTSNFDPIMSKPCPYCSTEVVEHGLQCDKCESWIHYACINIPPYMIISLSKSKRVYSCISCVHKKYSEDFPAQHTLIEKVINDLKESFKVDQTHDAEPTQVPQSTPDPRPTSPIVDPFVRSPPHTPTSVSSTMIPVVTLPPPVVLATTDESAPASVPLPPTIPILTAKLTPAAVTSISPQHAKGNPTRPCKFYMQGHCQYGRRGQSCPNQHPSMCFKFLRYGTRWCNKLDCTYSHPKMCKTALATGRCDRKNCFYYHKTGTIRPIAHKPNSGQSSPTVPLMELNLPPYQNNKRPPYPSLNHKASRPHTTTPQSHLKNRTSKQPQTQATQWDFPIATQSIFPQTYPSTNYHHLPTQHPTVETITPKPNSNSQSVTNPFLDQMNAIKQLMLDMQQAQSKLLLTMNQAWPLLQTN